MDINGLPSYVNTFVVRGLHPPPEVILKWPRPNYVDPEERGWAAPAVLLVMMVITFLVYVARMWARLVVSKNAGLDDILISLSILPLFGLTIAAILAILIYGFQWHVWDQTSETLVTSRQIAMAIELNYLVSTTLIKVSILCFYRRITERLKNSFMYWVWGCIVFCVVYGIVFGFLITFTCSPVVGFFHVFDLRWMLKNKLTCRDEGAIIVACAAISSVQDLVICMLPAFLIWNLQISKRQKIALCGIFGLGLITCVCGILRTYYATYLYYFTWDITWIAYYGWVWTTLEAQLAVICCSAPALKVFFARYFQKYSTTRFGYSASASRSRSRKTPLPSSSRSHTGLHSNLSQNRSEITGGGGGPLGSDFPLHSIKVSQGLDVCVEERDDISQKSFASTKGLTALPMPTQASWHGRGDWIEGCRTVCSALKPGSRDSSQSRSLVKDVEAGRPI